MSTRGASKELRRELLSVAEDLRAFRESMLDSLDRITDRVAALIETAGDAPLMWTPPPGFILDPEGRQLEGPGKEGAS